MTPPDAKQHNPSPDYLRGILSATGRSREEVAKLIGVSRRSLYHYLAPDGPRAPYAVQYAIECLATKKAP